MGEKGGVCFCFAIKMFSLSKGELCFLCEIIEILTNALLENKTFHFCRMAEQNVCLCVVLVVVKGGLRVSISFDTNAYTENAKKETEFVVFIFI